MATADGRGMEAAEAALLSLQSKTQEALTQSVLTRHLVTAQMQHYLHALRLDVSTLPVLHVAGTKGKGSTCAFAESVLRHCGLTTGLFTSPHLIHITERFKVNGASVSLTHPVTTPLLHPSLHSPTPRPRPSLSPPLPVYHPPSPLSLQIPDSLYLHHFWAVWDRLHAAASPTSSPSDLPPVPSFFRFLTLVALHLFSSLHLDVVILEVGMGGRLDSTNVIPRPIACAISSIGFDHMEVLGHTLPLIAREKGGILKPATPALTIPQPPDVLDTLQQCAQEEGTTLTVLPLLPPNIPLGLDGAHQVENATLAVGLCRLMLQRQAAMEGVGGEVGRAWEKGGGEGVAVLPKEVLVGLKSTAWAGRCQQFVDSEVANLTYYVDGAHTDASMLIACRWFQQRVHADSTHPLSPSEVEAEVQAGGTADDELILKPTPSLSSGAYNVLLFNAGHVRNPFELLQPAMSLSLTDSACQFGHFVSAPFDHDRPHLQRTPSFEDLLAQQPPDMQQLAASLLPLSSLPPPPSPPTWQHTLFRVFDLLHAWHHRQSTSSAAVAPAMLTRCVRQASSGQAIGSVRRMAMRHPKVHFRVLVCGSLYLVGNVLDKIGIRIS